MHTRPWLVADLELTVAQVCSRSGDPVKRLPAEQPRLPVLRP